MSLIILDYLKNIEMKMSGHTMLRSDYLALNRHMSVTYKTKRSKEMFVNQCFTGLPGLYS